MKSRESHKSNPPGAAVLKWMAAGRVASTGTRVLALAALWMLAVNCVARESPAPALAALFHGSPAVEFGHGDPFEFVIVEPKGWGPQGFQFQISLDSATRVPESALNLSAGESGLLVTARDIDGMGNDLDLIIKSARSFSPIGVWINDHRGGFVKADSRIYAQSIWADPPLLLAFGLPDTLQRAIVPLPQPCIHPLLPLRSGESRTSGNPGAAATSPWPPLRLTDPHTTRGPPARS